MRCKQSRDRKGAVLLRSHAADCSVLLAEGLRGVDTDRADGGRQRGQ
jgi:hypothetical protein